MKDFHNTIRNVIWKLALHLIMAYALRKKTDKRKQWCPPLNYGWLKANADAASNAEKQLAAGLEAVVRDDTYVQSDSLFY